MQQKYMSLVMLCSYEGYRYDTSIGNIDCIMIIASPASGCDGMILILKVSYGVGQIYKITPVLTSIRIMANWFVHVTSHRNINVHFRSNGAGTHSFSFVYKAANCNWLPPNANMAHFIRVYSGMWNSFIGARDYDTIYLKLGFILRPIARSHCQP